MLKHKSFKTVAELERWADIEIITIKRITIVSIVKDNSNGN
jgi:hypothetical protein